MNRPMFSLRPYRTEDCAALAALFYETVHAVNARDYTPQQLDAWATGEVDLDAWDRSFREHDTVIAEQNGSIVGFGDMDASGYLDRLYVHKDCQGRGVASAICAWLERRSAAAEYITHASLTARPFLEQKGLAGGTGTGSGASGRLAEERCYAQAPPGGDGKGEGLIMLHIGCHLSSSRGYAHMGKEALSIGADTFQFFTRNPRGGTAKALNTEDLEALRRLLEEHGFTRIIAHAPYTLNACAADEGLREFARRTMEDDLMRMEYLPGNYYNFHPGSHVKQGPEEGVRKLRRSSIRCCSPASTRPCCWKPWRVRAARWGAALKNCAPSWTGGAERSFGRVSGHLPCVGRRLRHCRRPGRRVGRIRPGAGAGAA